MGRRKRYFLALLLPDKESKLIRSWQEKFDSKIYRRPPPHITIGFNTFEEASIANLIPKLQQLFMKYPKFHLNSKGINVFSNNKSILHLEIEENDELVKLHDEIVSLKADSRPTFNPHITIAKLSVTKLKEAEQYMGKRPTKFEFVTTNIGLFEERTDGPWKQIKTF